MLDFLLARLHFCISMLTKKLKNYRDLKDDACVKKQCGQIKFSSLFALLYADSKDCILIARTYTKTKI